MKRTVTLLFVLVSIFLFFAVMFEASGKEVWLTPARKAALSRIKKRPHIKNKKNLDPNTIVYTWTDGLHETVTTQKVKRVLGKKAKSAWQSRLEAKEKEKQLLLDDISAVKDKPTKKNLEAIIKKYKKSKKPDRK